MIIGDPYKIAFWIDVVPKWNDDDSTWINGIFSLCVNGKIYPCVDTSTLNSDLSALLDTWHSCSMPCTNESLFHASKTDALRYLLEITYPTIGEQDYKYKLSTQTIEDNDIYSFILAYKNKVRIVIATVPNNNGSLEIDETKIDEVIMDKSEIFSMVGELESYYQTLINNKQQTD